MAPANPTLTVPLSGFVNGDTLASLTTPPTVTTTATTASPVGTYTITASGAADRNYTISYVAGTLTVSQDATTTVASTSSSSSPLGQAITLTATVTANAPGSGTPTGSVDFLDTTTGDDLGSVALSDGKASLSHRQPAAWLQLDQGLLFRGQQLPLEQHKSKYDHDQPVHRSCSTPRPAGPSASRGTRASSLTGGVYVDSSSSTAISASGNAAVKASVIDVHGGVQKSGNASFSPHRPPAPRCLPIRWPLGGAEHVRTDQLRFREPERELVRDDQARHLQPDQRLGQRHAHSE